jgi:hypothetical protein
MDSDSESVSHRRGRRAPEEERLSGPGGCTGGHAVASLHNRTWRRVSDSKGVTNALVLP